MNYNDEQTEYMVREYINDPSRATVYRLADALEKSLQEHLLVNLLTEQLLHQICDN